MIRTLYLSYDGLTDPLGQSQVLPYLLKLSEDKEIHIISCEKSENYKQYKQEILSLIEGKKIYWHPLNYHKYPPIFSTIWDLLRIKNLATHLNKTYKFQLVHCRSHLMAIVGDYLKKSLGIPYLFDMRSFFPEERVDGNLWPQKNPIFKLIFNYFKAKEVEMFESSDQIVVLTNSSKKILSHTCNENKITVIPCCADFDLFNFKNVSTESINIAKSDLELNDNHFVLSYLGSVGTWYELDNMLKFFAQVKLKKPNAVLIFFTPSEPNLILSKLEKHGVKKDDIRIRFIDRIDLPRYLLVSSISIFFIKNTFSKKASSPTKHAELMGLGIPVISNFGVGDLDVIINATKTGQLIDMNEVTSIDKVINSIDHLVAIDRDYIRKRGKEIYSLTKGSLSYDGIYSNIINK
jgi:glycosyltransferase involved in cell wall biosynthesis